MEYCNESIQTPLPLGGDGGGLVGFNFPTHYLYLSQPKEREVVTDDFAKVSIALYVEKVRMRRAATLAKGLSHPGEVYAKTACQVGEGGEWSGKFLAETTDELSLVACSELAGTLLH
jgi:hypothetical protein